MMDKALLPTEVSLDDEIKELCAYRRSYEFLVAADRQLNDPATCHICDRDLEGRGVCFLRIEGAVQPLCYGCTSEIRKEGKRMISENYSIGEFLIKIQDLSYLEIHDFIQEEINEAYSQVKGADCPANRYLRQLKSFNFFLSKGKKPAGISNEIYHLFRPVCKRLIEKGEFEPTVLDLFE
jgi:hypothetical protein